MTAVVGRAWGWVRSWGSWSRPVSEHAPTAVIEEQKQSSSGKGGRGWTSWIWGGWKRQSDQNSPVEEFWEAPDKIQPMEIEDLCAEKHETNAKAKQVPKWWNKFLPTYYIYWPSKAEPSGLKRRKHGGTRDPDLDGDYSDYGTPPPSPTPSSSTLTSPFRFFVDSWQVEVQPEHYEICFNFLRHLFDLFVVGFLWTVSSPTKLILEILGVQGALRLWFHGMAMFFVSTVGMAGLFWLIQEYLAQFALIYGIVQAIVISVSVRESVIFGEDEEDEEEQKDDEGKETDALSEKKEHKEKLVSAKEKIKTS